MSLGYGLCFMDMHGDAAQELLGNVPSERAPHDVVYYDPSSPSAPAFNLFRLPYDPMGGTYDRQDFLTAFAWGLPCGRWGGFCR